MDTYDKIKCLCDDDLCRMLFACRCEMGKRQCNNPLGNIKVSGLNHVLQFIQRPDTIVASKNL